MAAPQELTDAAVRGLKPPATGMEIVWDREVKGFGIRVTAKGARAFILNYRSARRQRLLTIGTFLDPWKTKAARRYAKELKERIDRGEDPMAERHAERTAPTINDLAALYRQKHLPRKRESSREMDEAMLTKDILPALGTSKVTAIEHRHVADLHHNIAKRAPYMANRVVALLSKMFSIAIMQGWRSDNPAKGINRMPEQKRERYLAQDEIKRLMAVLDRHPGNASNAIKLLLLSGARKGEVLNATWDQFDLDNAVWTKPSSHTKQNKVHRVPLSADAITVLKAMRQAADERVEQAKRQGKIIPAERFLFPSTSRKGQAVAYLGKEWHRFCQEAELDGVRVHDLRHSFASVLASSGASLPIIGAMLGHTQPSTTARYSHLLDEPLRQAAETVSSLIRAARGAPDKVASFPRPEDRAKP